MLRNTLLTAAQSDYIIFDNMLRNMLYYLYAEVLLMNQKTGNPVLA